jgi:hypothetical protein
MEPQATNPKPDVASDVELVPLARPPLDQNQIDVTLATDPVPYLEKLRRTQRRWKLVGVACLFGFAVMTVLIAVQFAATWLTCRLLYEARQHADQAKQETAAALEENFRISGQLAGFREEMAARERQLAAAVQQWQLYEQKILQVLDRDNQLEAKRNVLVDLLIREADAAMDHIRREGEEQASMIAVLLQEKLHEETHLADSGNPFLPRRR